MSREPIQFASLITEEARVELGWRPRDATLRLKRNRSQYHNWLVVHGRISCNAGQWEFVDQSLLEEEAAAFGRFLLKRPWPVGEATQSIESLITLSACEAADQYLGLSIRFCGEAGPRWLWQEDNHTLWRVGVVVNVQVREHQLIAFAKTWLAMLGLTQ